MYGTRAMRRQALTGNRHQICIVSGQSMRGLQLLDMVVTRLNQFCSHWRKDRHTDLTLTFVLTLVLMLVLSLSRSLKSALSGRLEKSFCQRTSLIPISEVKVKQEAAKKFIAWPIILHRTSRRRNDGIWWLRIGCGQWR